MFSHNAAAPLGHQARGPTTPSFTVVVASITNLPVADPEWLAIHPFGGVQLGVSEDV